MDLKLLTQAEVAEVLRTTPETVRHWHQVGKGPKSVKVGKHRLYAAVDVQEWIDGLKDSVA